MVHITWEDCKEAFEQDGSLRDIYVLDTALDDWQKFIDFINQSNYKFSFFVGNKLSPFPSEAGYIFEQKESLLLSISINGMIINCHFFRHRGN